MNKTILTLCGLLGVVCSSGLVATSELRSPLGRFGDVWFDYRYILNPVNDNGWQVDVQKAIYERCSARAFGLDPKCFENCDLDKVTTNTVPLSTLFFNKSVFKGQEVFFGGNLNGCPSNFPGLVFANLSPQISYEERGITLGVHAYRALSSRPSVRIGGRVGLPIKKTKVEEDRSCGFERADAGANCVVSCRQENTAENVNNQSDVCVYRLDYLSTLLLPNGLPMVQYGDATSPTKIANFVADSSVVGLKDSQGNIFYSGFQECSPPQSKASGPNTSAYLLRRATETMPFNPIDPLVSPNTQDIAPDNFILQNICAANLPVAGNVGNDNDRYRFVNGMDYAANIANNPAEQAKWFVTPVPGEGNNAINTLTEEMFNVISFVVQKQGGPAASVTNATEFFRSKCVDLCASQSVVGAGDLETQIYAGNYWESAYINGFIGFRLPTGKEHKDSNKVYFQPTGHNGHFEMMFGIDGGFHPTNWFAFSGDVAYHHVFKHSECRAAPFCGATVRNIGPSVSADVSWGWTQLNAVMTFFHPKESNLGCTLGYEFYAKLKDNISLCEKTAKDFLGKDRALDANLLEKNTNSQTHKVRGTGFYRIGYAEFMMGASYIFAGKHAMRETEWHVGMNVSF